MKRNWKRLVTFTLLLAVLIGVFTPAFAGSNDVKPDPDAAAMQFLLLLKDENYKQAQEMFGDALSSKIRPEDVVAKWKSVLKWLGPIQTIGQPESKSKKGHIMVVLPVKFKNADTKMIVMVNRLDKITGFYVTGVDMSSDTYKAPEYVKKHRIKEKKIEIVTGKYRLPGVFTMPDARGPFPTVVLVHGSGPLDRDETVGPNKVFRDIAWGLATKGIASIRYDKRTKVYPGDYIYGLDNYTGSETTTDDAVSAVKLAMKTRRVDKNRVYVLGHSLGGTLMPRIAQRCPKCAGFIIMAGAARPLEDLLMEQYTYIFALDGKISKKEQDTLDKLEKKVEQVKSVSLTKATLPSKVPQWPPSFWLNMRGYVPPEDAQKVGRPMLILQGERDYQVTMDDFKIWKKHLDKREDVKFISYPALNHLMIPGKGKSSPSEYFVQGHVDKAVIEDIVKWVKGVK